MDFVVIAANIDNSSNVVNVFNKICEYASCNNNIGDIVIFLPKLGNGRNKLKKFLGLLLGKVESSCPNSQMHILLDHDDFSIIEADGVINLFNFYENFKVGTKNSECHIDEFLVLSKVDQYEDEMDDVLLLLNKEENDLSKPIRVIANKSDIFSKNVNSVSNKGVSLNVSSSNECFKVIKFDAMNNLLVLEDVSINGNIIFKDKREINYKFSEEYNNFNQSSFSKKKN